MAASGNDYDDLCESVENCSLNSSRSDDRTEPKSSIGIIEKDLRKILELFNKESSKDIKPLVVAQLTGIGNNKKSVSKLLHFLKNKNLLTVKTGKNSTDPRWSKHPSNTYTDKNLREWAAELHNKSRPGSEANLCESVENCSLNSSRSDNRTEPKSSIGIEIPIIELKGHTFNVDEGKSVAIECNIIDEKKYRPPFWEKIHENDETNILTIREDKKEKYFGLKSDPPFLRILNSEMSDRGYYRCCIEYSTSNGEETVRSKKAHLIVEKAVKPGDTHIDQQVNIKVNNMNADTINMGGDETNIIVKKPNTSVGSTSSSSSENVSSSENEMSENFDEINSVCGDVDINKEKSQKMKPVSATTELQPSKQQARREN